MAKINTEPDYGLVVFNDGELGYTIISTQIHSVYQTEEEALAEIDRLKAEWRKEQK